MTTHSRSGGSKAAQWLNCPGSVPLSDQAPPGTTSRYAEEGSFAHALAEKALLDGEASAKRYLNTAVELCVSKGISKKLVNEEMIAAVDVYLDAVWSEYAEGDEIYVEEKFVLDIKSAEPGEVFGSNDCTIYSPRTGKLTIFDYKHGQGVGVSAYENKQLMFYAAGAYASHPEWNVKSIELVIVQPRGPFDDKVSRWEMPMFELIDYPALITRAVADSKLEEPTFSAGEHCRWCPASEICTVREKSFLDAALLDFDGIAEIEATTPLPAAATVDVARLAAILEGFDHLSAWVDTIRDRVNTMMLAGEKVPGFKVVDKVGRRKWDDDKDPASYLTIMYGLAKHEVCPPKLVTITEAEKLLKAKLDKEAFKAAKEDLTVNYMTKESSGYAVVLDSDRRPAVVPVAQEFGSVNVDSLFGGE